MPDTAPPRRRRLRWSVRALMLLVLVVGLPIGWKARRASLQRRAVAEVRRVGGFVEYDWQAPSPVTGGAWVQKIEPDTPAWARRALGDEYFQEVVRVDLPGNRPIQPPGVADPVGAATARDQLACLDGLDRLESLYLTMYGPLGPEGAARLARLRRLKRLDLGDFDPAAAAAVGHLDRLENLGISRPFGPNFWGRATPAEIRATRPVNLAFLDRLPRLRSLSIAIPVDAAGLARIARIEGLESLGLEAPGATDADLASLARLTSLEKLSLSSATGITDLGLEKLAGLPRLESVDLPDSPITEAGLRALDRCPTLGSVRVSKARIDPETLRQLRAARPGRAITVY